MDATRTGERLARLGKACKVAEQAHEDARAALHDEVIAADGLGWSLGDIARASGLSRSGVHGIITRRS